MIKFDVDDEGRPELERRVGGLRYRLFYWEDPEEPLGKENGWTIAMFDGKGDVPQAMYYPDLESALLKFGEMGAFDPRRSNQMEVEPEEPRPPLATSVDGLVEPPLTIGEAFTVMHHAYCRLAKLVGHKELRLPEELPPGSATGVMVWFDEKAGEFVLRLE